VADKIGRNGKCIELLFTVAVLWFQLPCTAQEQTRKPLLPTRTVECPHCGRDVPTTDNRWPILLLGFAGQGAFGARFVIQWIASERAKTSVIPELFWWFSMTGGVLLFFYGWAILAWPIVIGQGLNCLIYGRNLFFVRRSAVDQESRAT
jgi:lipid-A-disaccharide synthase-like uncharacterized protein